MTIFKKTIGIFLLGASFLQAAAVDQEISNSGFSIRRVVTIDQQNLELKDYEFLLSDKGQAAISDEKLEILSPVLRDFFRSSEKSHENLGAFFSALDVNILHAFVNYILEIPLHEHPDDIYDRDRVWAFREYENMKQEAKDRLHLILTNEQEKHKALCTTFGDRYEELTTDKEMANAALLAAFGSSYEALTPKQKDKCCSEVTKKEMMHDALLFAAHNTSKFPYYPLTGAVMDLLFKVVESSPEKEFGDVKCTVKLAVPKLSVH